MLKIDMEQFTKEALQAIGGVLVDQAQTNMRNVSMGRVYIIGGKTHIASKAGDSPNNQSGALSKSIRFEIDGNILEFGAGDEKINYAKHLELGTSKMGVRPNYTKSILQNKTKIDLMIARSLSRNMRFSK